MKAFIFGKRNLIHVIDLRQTLRSLIISRKFVEAICAQGKDVLFVGTKNQARNSVKTHALRCGMHYVNERWLGGTLTNFRTIRSRLSRLLELEDMERSGQMALFSKKMIATLTREKEKIHQNLVGIRNMDALPGALVVIDPRREKNAVAEANKLSIPIIALTDTDCDPSKVDIVIPGNDDAMRAIDIVCAALADMAIAGKAKAPKAPPRAEQAAAPTPEPAAQPPRHRRQRPQGQRFQGRRRAPAPDHATPTPAPDTAATPPQPPTSAKAAASAPAPTPAPPAPKPQEPPPQTPPPTPPKPQNQ